MINENQFVFKLNNGKNWELGNFSSTRYAHLSAEHTKNTKRKQLKKKS